MSGKDDGSFGPDNPVHRAQFAKMMCGLLTIDVSEDQSYAPFVDLGPDDLSDLYPHEFVGAAYRAGLTKGKTKTTFAPYANITLAQVISMVARAADAYRPGLLATPPADWYGWWVDTDPNHGADVRRADYADLLAFVPIKNPSTDLQRPATRGEVSQILVNLRHKLAGVSIALCFEGKRLDLTSPVLVEANRYYIPLAELIERIAGTITIRDGVATIATTHITLVLDTNASHYAADGNQFALKQQPVVSDGILYLSLFDLQKMLALKVDWDEDSGIVNLFWNRDAIAEARQPAGGKTALVRFEDITAGQRYSTAESLAKLRVVFDYCYAKGIPMQLGWVPRYVDPGNGIDNAPAQDYSMHNADFIYTLDYFADRNGLIGLHGYTHQYGNQVSIAGTEIDAEHNASESSIVKRIHYAIDDASSLGIPIAFFESPHYGALPYQKDIIGRYFDIIYEHRLSAHERNITKVSTGGRVVTYIPTPLGYIDGVDNTTHGMIARIGALGPGDLASLFYHPDFENYCIAIARGEDGYPSYQYAVDSPLHRIVDALAERGYTFRGIATL